MAELLMEIIQINFSKGAIHSLLLWLILHCVFFLIRYSSQSRVQETESNDQELPCTIWTQTETNKKDQATHVARSENAVEDIQNSDDSVQFYTGLPDFDTFKALFETLCEYGMDEIESDQRMELRLVDQFLLVLMRLRLGLLVKDLAYRFKLSSSSVSRIFFRWIIFMRQCLSSIVFLPELKILQQRIPSCFLNFSDNYKSHNTFKSFIGISMTGAVCLVSKL